MSEPIGAACYAAIFASPAIGVAIWDGEGRLIEANAALSAIDPLGRGRNAGDPMEDLVPAAERASFGALLRDATETQSSRIFEFSVAADNGSTRVLGAALGARSVGGGICLFVDVTRRAADRRPGLDVSSRMAAIGTLAGGIAHEINNPLAYAMGNLSFAIEHLQGVAPSTPELAVVLLALRDALEGADRVRRTVRDLKIFSRPTSEGETPVDLEKVIGAAVSMGRNEVQSRARVVVDFGGVPPIVGSEAHLAQAFLTLLLEAAHGIEEGRADEHEIRVSTRRTSDEVVTVDIAPGGPSAEARPATLRPVETLGGSESDDAGFGIAFCRRLVEGYGGSIFVEGTAGSSAVRVVLRVWREAPADARTPARRTPAQRGARVLVVDDEPRIGSAIARILAPKHDVTAVATALDALARLESGEDYDVILCDLMMPEMSGTDLYRTLVTKAPRFADRMVFMTGGPFSTRGASLLETVPNARLEKPFSPESLRAVVEQFET